MILTVDVGMYLSRLHRYNRMPNYIDPTAPYEQVEFDLATGNFAPLACPEVFSHLAQLPSYMQLEPLVNIHKQRLIAGVIKALVSGQHLASRAQYTVDRKIYHKCLRLRGLNPEMLQRVSSMYYE
jgi:Gdp/GTP exchange factor required for growth at low temperatures